MQEDVPPIHFTRDLAAVVARSFSQVDLAEGILINIQGLKDLNVGAC
jgi:hypothetical protein